MTDKYINLARVMASQLRTRMDYHSISRKTFTVRGFIEKRYEDLETLIVDTIKLVQETDVSIYEYQSLDKRGWVLDSISGEPTFWFVAQHSLDHSIESIRQSDPVYAKLLEKCFKSKEHMNVLCDSFKVKINGC